MSAPEPGEGLLVVADGMGGHCTGWLGARLAVRALVEPFAGSDTEVRFVGAADGFPDDWGWAGAMQSRRAAELVYEACAADFGDPAALPRDLATVFSEIDRVVANVPKHTRIHGLLVGCIAATIEGARVRGTHVGIGRALLLRAGAHHFERLVVEYYLHLVADRMPEGRELLLSPRRAMVSRLGLMDRAWVGQADPVIARASARRSRSWRWSGSLLPTGSAWLSRGRSAWPIQARPPVHSG